MLMVLSSLLATAKSGKAPPLKWPAVNATGFWPTLKEVCGKFGETGDGLVGDPRLEPSDSRERATGKRSPTKKFAGLPSCARRRTCLPLFTKLSALEKSAATPGRVRRKVVYPPPT